jgi:hypothetical protein
MSIFYFRVKCTLQTRSGELKEFFINEEAAEMLKSDNCGMF